MTRTSDIARTTWRQAVRLFKGHVLRDPMQRAAAHWFLRRGDETLRLDYPLDSASVVLDCGGYEGDWAAAIHARHGCRVLVFEPVSAYVQMLRQRFAACPQIQVLGYGLHGRDEQARMAVSGDASSHVAVAAQGGRSEFETVQLRDVAAAWAELGLERVALMKINIEGGEFELLDRLIDSGCIQRVDHLQVQFHRFVPDAVKRRHALRERLRQTHAESYNFEFVWESWRRT